MTEKGIGTGESGCEVGGDYQGSLGILSPYNYWMCNMIRFGTIGKRKSKKMGSFKGHLVPGSLFVMVGVWHVWCCVVRYASDPKSFRVRAWNPVPVGGGWKHLELYVVAVGALIDLCIELLYSTHLKFLVNGVLNPSHMNNFEHSAMLLMFFLFGLVALVSQKTRYLPLPEGALGLIVATAFCAEFLLFYFHSTSHKGLGGHYHLILVILIALCVVSSVAAAFFPTSFPVDLACGISVTLQGLWFYQTSFSLFGPMMPDGCHLDDHTISCRSMDTEVRGQVFANLQLFSMVFALFLLVGASYLFAVSRYGHSDLRTVRTRS